MMNSSILPLLAVVCLALQQSSALECYTCSGTGSATIEESGDNCVRFQPFNKPDTRQCDGVCAKTVRTLVGVKVVNRECLDECVNSRTNVDFFGCCSEDKCNSGEKAAASLSFVLAASLVKYMM